MTAPADRIFGAIDGTWPARAFVDLPPWRLRDADGGGKRVGAASALGPIGEGDIARAETAMRGFGQTPLFMLRPGDAALDADLAARGYDRIDPSTIRACPVELLTDLPIPRVTVFSIWEPLAMMAEIWATGGIGPARLRVMARAPGPHTGFLARFADKPAGVGFAAVHDGVAMVHAVEILPHQRRRGMGRWIMRAAAIWAAEQGAETLAVICTDANTAANRLYASLGMTVVGQYHYRKHPNGD
ncbi:MAG: GNAT family N-acetyltransferase [Rhodobacteraceae bacterium]|nr:GNAT family N-acetyltransferase [Paracoccaceae bacterium]